MFDSFIATGIILYMFLTSIKLGYYPFNIINSNELFGSEMITILNILYIADIILTFNTGNFSIYIFI